MHGFSLNVNPDMSYFGHIVPCGMPDAEVTSMGEQGIEVVVDAVVPPFVESFARVFQSTVFETTLDELHISASVAASTVSP